MARAHFEEVMSQKATWTNTSCDYYPCHHEVQDCTWCFCPFYPCGDDLTGGRMVISERTGEDVWSCIDCTWVHREEEANDIMDAVGEMGDVTDWDAGRLLELRTKMMGGNDES
jgi:Zn-finger protein